MQMYFRILDFHFSSKHQKVKNYFHRTFNNNRRCRSHNSKSIIILCGHLIIILYSTHNIRKIDSLLTTHHIVICLKLIIKS
jgi:hypothetical protein